MRVVFCNCPPGKAESLAHGLLESRLAACVNMIPGIRSLYWWEGRLCDESETTLLIKIRADDSDRVLNYIRAHHPYKVPEIAMIAVDQLNTDYREWLESVTIRDDD